MKLSTEKIRSQMPRFGDLLGSKELLGLKKPEQRNGVKIPTVKNIGYNRTYVELETTESVVGASGEIYPKVVTVEYEGFVSFRTLKRRFSRGLKSFYYLDDRTDRGSYHYFVKEVRGVLTFWWQDPKTTA